MVMPQKMSTVVLASAASSLSVKSSTSPVSEISPILAKKAPLSANLFVSPPTKIHCPISRPSSSASARTSLTCPEVVILAEPVKPTTSRTPVPTASAVAAEYCYEKLLHKSITVRDGSAVVTGLLIGMNMPPQIDLWIPCLGSVFAIVVIKQLYGGLGKNFMNPALGARCFLLISFSSRMTTFSEGKGLWKLVTQVPATTDALSGATPLAYLKTGICFDLKALLIGNHMGCIGEVSAAALLAGGLILLAMKVIRIRIPGS